MGPVSFLVAGLLFVTIPSSAEGQILNRLRSRAEDALDNTSVIQRLLEEPPGITTDIRDAHTEIPFLDDHNPSGSANMAELPRNDLNAFFAPPGLYEMEAMTYCIQAGTYGPGGGDGYSLAPLEGDLAPVIRTLMRRSIDHPEISQHDLQSLIWAFQSRIAIDELPEELQNISYALLDPGQVEKLSDNVVDWAKEQLLMEARDHMPDPVLRVAEAEAELRDLLRTGAAFDELEETAVLAGLPPGEELVRQVPSLRWSYHPDGYFIRFDPYGYERTYVQSYVPEAYLVERDSEGRVAGVVGPRGTWLGVEYEDGPAAPSGKVSRIRGVRMVPMEGTLGGFAGEWDVEGWTLMGNDIPEEAPAQVGKDQFSQRRRDARARRRLLRDVMDSTRGSEGGPGPGRDLADLAHIRTGLRQANGQVPEEVFVHLANAWQYTLCVEAGGCTPARVAWKPQREESLPASGIHGPATGIPADLASRLGRPTAWTPLPWAGGGSTMDPGGNVAAPGNTGRQRLVTSGKTPLDKANLAMKALSIFLALADVIGSGGLGSAAYNALGLGGLPVGHLGLPTMMAGAMISQVTDVWSSATDALAGDTGGGASGESGGESGGADGSGGTGGDFGGIEDPGGVEPDPTDTGILGEGEDRSESRSSGDDYESTPPPNPPHNPAPAPAGGGGSPGGAEAANSFTESLLVVLHHTQAVVDSEQRRDAAFRAGDTEWAERQAGLVGEHQRWAGLGMMEAARRLDDLLEIAGAGVESHYIYPEDIAEIQDRLGGQGWTAEESRIASLLGITQSELESLRQHLTSMDPAELEGDLEESIRLWAKDLRTKGILWQALSGFGGVSP